VLSRAAADADAELAWKTGNELPVPKCEKCGTRMGPLTPGGRSADADSEAEDPESG
jgi:hypothetical protein